MDKEHNYLGKIQTTDHLNLTVKGTNLDEVCDKCDHIYAIRSYQIYDVSMRNMCVAQVFEQYV